MVKLVLAVFDTFAWLLRKLGVDYRQFRAILEAKLTIDTRSRRAGVETQQSRRKSPKNVFVWTLFFNALMGAFIGITVAVADSPLVGMTIEHSFVMLMVGMILIADYSTVLLDTADSQILQPRPVSNRTILVARLAHITTYLTLLTLSLAAGAFVAGTVKYHWLLPLVFGVTLIAATLFVLSVVAVLYLLLMRFINEEKLRDLITYVQIAMTVVLVGLWQLVPRMMDMRRLKERRIDDARWIYFYPPTWFAAPTDLLAGNAAGPQLILTALAVGGPLVALLVVLWLAPAFRVTPESAVSAARPFDPPAARGQRSNLAETLATIVIRRPSERPLFGFIWRLTARDRQFKRRTYPGFAFIFIFAAIFMLRDDQGLSHALATLGETKKYLLLLYFAGLMIPSAVANIRFTEQPEAAWIYAAAPLEQPGVVLAAAVKVLMLQLIVPTFVLITALTLVLWGPRIIPDIILAFCATLVVCWLHAFLLGRALPFSEPFGAMEASGRLVRSLLLFVGPAAFGLAHYGLTFVPYGVAAGVPIAIGLNFLVARQYARTTWARLSAG
jgi:ABC-2 type transport system permease protein